MTLVYSLVHAYVATLTVATLAVGIRTYAIPGEDLSAYLLVQ